MNGRRWRYHPWRRLDQLRIDVRYADLDDRLGCWDPDTRLIWLDRRLGQAGRRSTLAHELVHAERGDEPCVSGWHERKQERAIDQEAARRLIPLEMLVDALLWSLDDEELAEDLWVDVDTVRSRRESLTAAEQAFIERRLDDAAGRIA